MAILQTAIYLPPVLEASFCALQSLSYWIWRPL